MEKSIAKRGEEGRYFATSKIFGFIDYAVVTEVNCF